jgi:outer membrane protein assembly factor BamD
VLPAVNWAESEVVGTQELALGIREEAVKYTAVLGANYPGTEWYEKAYELVGDHASDVTPS